MDRRQVATFVVPPLCAVAGFLVAALSGRKRPEAAAVPRSAGVAGATGLAATTALQLPSTRPATASLPVLDLSTLDGSAPQAFYLTVADLEQLSDCFAVVGGVRLPLHSQMLSAQSAVLRQLFVGQKEGDAGSEAMPDLSAAFQDISAEDTACFLRLIYCAHDAHRANLAVLASGGRLAAVAGLAHKLDAGRLLGRIDNYLRSVVEDASMQQLVATLHVAQHCQLEQLQTECVGLMAGKLAAAGKQQPAVLDKGSLAALDSDTLAQLMCTTMSSVVGGVYHPPTVFDICDGSGGRAGGFTFVVDGFTKRVHEAIYSPWVEMGGFEWRLRVHPTGDSPSPGTHVSAYLCINNTQAAAAGIGAVTASIDLEALDLRAGTSLR